ncbi:DNA-binding domain-containing protein [Pseudohalioglobus lutimaris]|uniref:HvfC family RiPP maturation protein n=1 Tax=Pseudohalioglobus lutimaris TaxID=1737061 RepID=UPI001FAED12C|nr:putative DNA-binding domain-containing protein [Pseudohalioglobus lutimaris]
MNSSTLRRDQLQMAAYLRDPNKSPAPPGVEERRLKVYRDLVYNNVEGFISGGFPVLRSLYTDSQWEALVRLFMDRHRCRTPYFLEISQEFVGFLMDEHQPRDCDPAFMTELAHYEWVELALDVSEEVLPEARAVSDLEHSVLRLSPLAWVLSYHFPVHEIGPGFQPAEAQQPTFLVVYRNRQDQVKFMALNGATARLLELLRDNDDVTTSGVLAQLATEMNLPSARITSFALEQISGLLELSVLVPGGN